MKPRPRIAARVVVTALAVTLGAYSVTSSVRAQIGSCPDAYRDLDRAADTVVSFDGRRVTFAREDYAALDSARRELLAMPPGTVVYAPVVVTEGPILMRLESQGGKVLQSISGTGNTSRAEFERLLERAAAPSGRLAREELKRVLGVQDLPEDTRKTILVLDLLSLGTIPEALGWEAPTVLRGGIMAGARHRRQLETLRIKASEFTAVVGYPASAAEYDALFRGERTAPLESWLERSEEFESIAREAGIKVVSGSNGIASKAEVLRSLEEARGVVFVLAHSRGARIRLAAGETVEIGPEDVARLSFKHAPYVVLRVCHGFEAGFQRAFRKAGAVGVSSNRGPVDAAAANRDVATFMAAMSSGKSVWEAIREIVAVGPVMPRTLLVQVDPAEAWWASSGD